MKNQKTGLNDSDKLLVTIALWIALVSLFATSLTLPMLPNSVRNGVVSFDIEAYSKYGNLFIVFSSVVPVLIVLIAASLKKHNRMQHNFLSMIIFCVMLSMSLSGLAVFGITRQFAATPVENPLSVCATVAVAITVILSVSCALIPRLFHTDKFASRATELSPAKAKLCANIDRYWNIGAYGYIVVGIIASFIPSPLAFVPVAIFSVGHIVMHIVLVKCQLKKADLPVETENPVAQSDIPNDQN